MKVSREYLQRIVREEMLKEQRGEREKAARKATYKPGEILRMAEKERLAAAKHLRDERKAGRLTKKQIRAMSREMKRKRKADIKTRRTERSRFIAAGKLEDLQAREKRELAAAAENACPDCDEDTLKAIASYTQARELANQMEDEVKAEPDKPEDKAPEEKGEQAAKEKEVQHLEHDRKYEYKVVENRWHTRRRGKEKWIDLEPPDDEDRRKRFKPSVDRLDKAFPKERSAAPAAEEKKPEPEKVDEGKDITQLESQMPEAWLQILGDCLEEKD